MYIRNVLQFLQFLYNYKKSENYNEWNLAKARQQTHRVTDFSKHTITVSLVTPLTPCSFNCHPDKYNEHSSPVYTSTERKIQEERRTETEIQTQRHRQRQTEAQTERQRQTQRQRETRIERETDANDITM
jgi:hypothetical protein